MREGAFRVQELAGGKHFRQPVPPVCDQVHGEKYGEKYCLLKRGGRKEGKGENGPAMEGAMANARAGTIWSDKREQPSRTAQRTNAKVGSRMLRLPEGLGMFVLTTRLSTKLDDAWREPTSICFILPEFTGAGAHASSTQERKERGARSCVNVSRG